MIIIKLFFTLFIIFILLMVSLAVTLWLKVRMHLRNPFLRQQGESPLSRDDNIIEGEYKVVNESHKDNAV